MVQQYEKAYFDAREVLYFRGKKVAKPTFGGDGLRYCPVDGSPLTDRGVFKEAWGDQLAEEILHELAESDYFDNCCRECDRIWLEFTDATQRYIEIFTQLQRAANRDDSASLAVLDLLLKDAAKGRQSARQNVRRHAATHAKTNQSCIADTAATPNSWVAQSSESAQSFFLIAGEINL